MSLPGVKPTIAPHFLQIKFKQCPFTSSCLFISLVLGPALTTLHSCGNDQNVELLQTRHVFSCLQVFTKLFPLPKTLLSSSPCGEFQPTRLSFWMTLLPERHWSSLQTRLVPLCSPRGGINPPTSPTQGWGPFSHSRQYSDGTGYSARLNGPRKLSFVIK